MSRNLVPLTSIVNDYLLSRENGDYDTSNEKQLMMYGKQAIRDELAISLSAYLKSVKLDVNTTLNTVALPSDYIEYTKIGVIDGNCQVQVLGLNEKINYAGAFAVDGGGDVIFDADGIETLSAKDCTPSGTNNGYTGVLFNNYYENFNNGRLFGLGGGNNARGYYRFNNMDNRIELNSEFSASQIVLEYIADESMSSDPQVPVEAEDFVRNYIYYRSISRKNNIPVSEKQRAEIAMNNSLKDANFKFKMFNKSEAAQQIYRRYQLSPKFLNN